MKKLLGSVLALALFLPAGANAELLKNLKLSGRIDLQGTAAHNVVDFQTKGQSGETAKTGQDRIGDMQTRVMVSLDWDLLDDVHSRVTLRKNNRVWGNGSQSVTGLESSIFADEAFINIDKLFGHVDAALGRQFIGEEGDLIAYYGPRTGVYGMRVTALDAAKFDVGAENWTLTALNGNPNSNDASLGVTKENRRSIRAIILGNKGNENISGKIYVWNRTTHNTSGSAGTSNDNLYIAGIKAKVVAGPAWLKAELASNFGAHRDTDTVTQDGASKYSGWALLLNGGAKFEAANLGMVTGWAEFGYGTGTRDSRSNRSEGFESISTDYRPGSLYGRFATATPIFANEIGPAGAASPASNGLSNRIVKGLGVKFTPASINKLTASVSAWDFWFSHSGRKSAESADQPQIGGNGNRHIGNEYDLELAWQHSENVLVKLGAASFQAGGFIREEQRRASTAFGLRGNSPAYLLTSDFSVKF